MMRQQTLFLVVGFALAAHVVQTAAQHPGLLLEGLFSRDVTQELLNNEASLLVPTTSSISASLRFARRQFLNATLKSSCKDNAIMIADNYNNRPERLPNKYSALHCGNSPGDFNYTSVGPSLDVGFVSTAASGDKDLNDGFIVTVTLNRCECGKVVFQDLESIHDRCHDKSILEVSNKNVALGKCCHYQMKTSQRLFFTAIDFKTFKFPSDDPCEEDNSVGISRKGDLGRMKYFCGSTGKPEFWKETDTKKENLVRLSRNLFVKMCRKTPDVEFLAYFYTSGKRGVPAADAVAAKSDDSCICGRLPKAKKGSRRRRSATGCSTKKQCRRDKCGDVESCRRICKETGDCIYKVCHGTKMCKEHCSSKKRDCPKEECTTMPLCRRNKHCKNGQCKTKTTKPTSKKPCAIPKTCKHNFCKSTDYCKNYCTNNCERKVCRNVDSCRDNSKSKICTKKKDCRKPKCQNTDFCLNKLQSTSTERSCKIKENCKYKECKKTKFCKNYCRNNCGKPECKNVGQCRAKGNSNNCSKKKHCNFPNCKSSDYCTFKCFKKKNCQLKPCKNKGNCENLLSKTTEKPCIKKKQCANEKCRNKPFCKKYCKNRCEKTECKNVGDCKTEISLKCNKPRHCKEEKCKGTDFCKALESKRTTTRKTCQAPRDCGKKRCRKILDCANVNSKCLKKKNCNKRVCRRHPNCRTTENPKTTIMELDRQGSTPLKYKAWPWIVLIEVKGKPVCQGILVGVSEVLTCDKCATSTSASDYTATVKDIKHGTTDNGEQKKTVKKVVKTAPSNCSGDMCLVLLILSSPVTFDKKREVTPVCLACINKKLSMLDETAFLSGYGFDPAATATSIQLKDTKGKIVDNSQCTNVPSGAFCFKMADKLSGHSCGTVVTDYGAPAVVRLGARGVYVHYSVRGILCNYDCNSRTGVFIEAFSTGVLSWIFENMESGYCHTPTRAGKKTE